jgi:hypothetical protein
VRYNDGIVKGDDPTPASKKASLAPLATPCHSFGLELDGFDFVVWEVHFPTNVPAA